jgi:hypothetical protein
MAKLSGRCCGRRSLWWSARSEFKNLRIVITSSIPEVLKRHEGRHVEVSAHVYADKNAIHAMSVKMLK